MADGKLLNDSCAASCTQLNRGNTYFVRSESNLPAQLNHSLRSIRVEPRSEDRSWRLLQIKNLTKGPVRDTGVGKSKIGMVKKIEDLHPDRQNSIFPAGNFAVFRQRKIGVKVFV